MKFSLIMGTVGRSDEVKAFLESITRQSYPNLELIVVDQNSNDMIERLCGEYRDAIDIKHIRIEKSGISHARNVGMSVATGDILAFPDDDCTYPKHVLSMVADLLESRCDLDGVTGVARSSETGGQTCGRFAAEGVLLTPSNIWRRHISITIFMKKRFCDDVGLFDEKLGVGAFFGAGEETDFLLRGLYNGSHILYCPDLTVYHPDPVRVFDEKSIGRAYTYGLGFGALFKKHVVYRKRYDLLPEGTSRLVRTLGGAMIYGLSDRARSRYYLRHLEGWLAGCVKYRPSCKHQSSPCQEGP